MPFTTGDATLSMGDESVTVSLIQVIVLSSATILVMKIDGMSGSGSVSLDFGGTYVPTCVTFDTSYDVQLKADESVYDTSVSSITVSWMVANGASSIGARALVLCVP